jgi:hypothetical protein
MSPHQDWTDAVFELSSFDATQQLGELGGNHVRMETGESFGVLGVKRNSEDIDWAGSGRVLVEPLTRVGAAEGSHQGWSPREKLLISVA